MNLSERLEQAKEDKDIAVKAANVEIRRLRKQLEEEKRQQKAPGWKIADKYGLVEYYDRRVYRFVEFISLNGNDYLKIPLPNANIDWTLAAFDLMKTICGKGEHYPVHEDYLDTANWLWIRLR